MNSKVTYRQQFTRCGKQRCHKCKDGAGHGPYWYAYWSENGRTISKYIGIHPPADIEIASSNVEVQHVLSREEKTGPVPLTSAEVHHNNSYAPKAVTFVTPVNNSSLSDEKVPGKSSGAPDVSTHLRVYLLGQFRVERRHDNEWQAVANRKWQRRRARALLGCLLSSPARRLGREQVMEALWPDLDIDTAANRLNGAVHELRQILEPEIARPAASQLLRLERDVLILADARHIWVDAEAFEALLNKANTTPEPEQIEKLLGEAAALYAGDYLLEELYSEWTAPRRESLRRGWMGLLLNLAELRAARGALASAIEPLERLLSTDPAHETAVRRLMTLLTQLDRRGEALRVYHQLVSVLQRDYDNEPLPETRDLYEALRQGTAHLPQVGIQQGAKYQFMHYFPNDASTSHPGTHYVPRFPDEASHERIAPNPEELFFQASSSFASARQLGRHNQSPLVGRDKELATMRQLMYAIENESLSKEAQLKPAKGGIRSSNFLLLMGESGIGKTRLAEELSQEAITRGWSVAWSRAFEQEGTISYRPWTELLRTLLQDAPKDLLLSLQEGHYVSAYVEQSLSGKALAVNAVEFPYNRLERLSVLLPELSPRDVLPQQRTSMPLPPEQERLLLWEATLAILSLLSRTNRILLVLDDLHWTDDSSLELLAYLARHLQDERILIVGTCRDAELMPSSNLRTLINDLRREQTIVTLPIKPLTEGQIGSLVAYLPKDIVESIQTQAGGNPFFAEELARYSDTDVANDTQVSTTTTLPETIAAVLDRRLSRLSSDCQTLLGKAAVMGGSFEFSQLLFMAGDQGTSEDTILDLLEEALRAGLLTEEGTGVRITYHFWHPLIVSHLYERPSAARRAQLHRRAANALLHLHRGHETEVAAAITHHLRKGGSDPMQIAHYAEIAGNRAYALSAYSEAQYYYREAIEAISEGSSPEVSAIEQNPLHLASLLERVAECYMLQGKFEEVRKLYEQVLELRNRQFAETSRNSNAQDLQTLRQQEAQRQAMIWREIGRAWFSTGNYAHAQQCFIHGEQVLREAGVASGAAWACIQLQHGNIARILGNYDEARRYLQVALEILEEVAGNQDRHNEYRSEQIHTSHTELETRTERSVIGNPLELGRAHEMLGITEAMTGYNAEALKHLNIALTIFERHDLVMAMAQVCGNLGAAYAVKAENSVARAYFQRSLELAERMGDLPNIAFSTGNLADVLARCGHLLEAEVYFKRSLEVAERINDRRELSWCCVEFAQALQDQGNLRGALEHIRRALSLGRSIKSDNIISFALIALAELRVTQAITICNLQFIDPRKHALLEHPICHRLLLRARAALQRALALEGLEAEVMAEGQRMMAMISFLFGDLETARQKALQTLEEAGTHQIKRVLARSHRLLGRILMAQGQREEATTHFEQAMQVFREHEFRLEYGRTLYSYGITLLERDRQKAFALLSEAREIFIDCYAAIDLEVLEHTLAISNLENVVIAK
ncbi:MAG TPA: tetratricopeptide repeat protein [Ktedonobacteraceae bacterium]|nr:tetratricopeptide repeat protein [Ktedonobacteraceae bacterium]